MFQQGQSFSHYTENKPDPQNTKTIPKKKVQMNSYKGISETPHAYKKQIFFPVTLKIIHQHYHRFLTSNINPNTNMEQLFKQSELGLRYYIVIAKIQSINNECNKYIFQINDGTIDSSKISIYYSKTSIQTTLTSLLKKGARQSEHQSISSLSFESSPIQGQPYFRFWLRMVLDRSEGEQTLRWNLQKIERIKFYDEITYHNCAAMLIQLKQPQ